MNTFSNGSRGTVAKEDAKTGFGISDRLITNSEKLILPPSTRPDGSVKKYNIEPFIPLTAYSNKEWISNPKVAFKFPSGSLKNNPLPKWTDQDDSRSKGADDRIR